MIVAPFPMQVFMPAGEGGDSIDPNHKQRSSEVTTLGGELASSSTPRRLPGYLSEITTAFNLSEEAP